MLGCFAAVLPQMRCKEREMANVITYGTIDLCAMGADLIVSVSKAFGKVNWYVRNRLYLHFNRKSQRGYVLKHAPNFYSELQAMGLHRLQWRRK